MDSKAWPGQTLNRDVFGEWDPSNTVHRVPSGQVTAIEGVTPPLYARLSFNCISMFCLFALSITLGEPLKTSGPLLFARNASSPSSLRRQTPE